MNNYKFTIQYDGTDFAGWQMQRNADTIQDELTRCLKILTREDITLIGAGRTDAGVHALGQTANFRTQMEIEVPKFQYSLNSMLPFSIAVLSMEKVDEKFHSRFDAKSRSYYYIFNSVKSPFYKKYSYFYPRSEKLDANELNELSKYLIGNKDYSSFAKTGSETETNFCDVTFARWNRKNSFLIFYIEANRFLRGMVRAIVGTMLERVEDRSNEFSIEKIFEQKNRDAAGRSVPAQGLILYKVRY
ncbi:MAG: tRNA pseudouridine(38-40) synthase TruA [bacterium]